MRAFYWILGLIELSAVERYTTAFSSVWASLSHGIPDAQILALTAKIELGGTTVMSHGTPRPMKIEFSRQPIIRQMASKKNGDTTNAWRSQAVSATTTQWWGKRLTISSIGRPGG